jgi:hypothetical protein
MQEPNLLLANHQKDSVNELEILREDKEANPQTTSSSAIRSSCSPAKRVVETVRVQHCEQSWGGPQRSNEREHRQEQIPSSKGFFKSKGWRWRIEEVPVHKPTK